MEGPFRPSRGRRRGVGHHDGNSHHLISKRRRRIWTRSSMPSTTPTTLLSMAMCLFLHVTVLLSVSCSAGPAPTPTSYLFSSFQLDGRRGLGKHRHQPAPPAQTPPSRAGASSTTRRHSIIPDDYYSQQHERMTTTPSWRRAEEKKPPSALESALSGLPGLAWHAHSGLVNFTGSVAGTVVSGFRAVVSSAPTTAAPSTSVGANVLSNRPHELYGENDEELFQDDMATGNDDGLFTPVQAYDDSLELVVWDDSTLYTPPLPDLGEAWEEDSPVMSQLQHELAEMLGRPPPTPSPRQPPPDDPNNNKGHHRPKKHSIGDDKEEKHNAPLNNDVAVAKALALATPSVEIEGNKKRGAALVLGKLAKAGTILVQVVLACALAVVRGPKRRLLQLAHILGVMLRAVIASTALFGTSVSTILRRVVSPRAKNLPRPDVFQRLTTTFTRFLHENYPWLLAHPIFYGRPFPWQWKGWKPQPPPSVSLGSGGSSIPGLPSLSALLRDLGEAVTPQGLMQKRQARRERREQQRNGGDEEPPWRLPLHVKDDWSKSILQLDHDGRHRVHFMSAPPSPPQQLDMVSPLDFAAFVPPSELKGKEEKMLEKEVKKVQQQHLLQEEEKLRQEEATATKAPSSSSSSSASSRGATLNGAAVAPGDAPPQQPSKGPDLFTSYFPHELVEEGQEASSILPQQQQQQQQQAASTTAAPSSKPRPASSRSGAKKASPPSPATTTTSWASEKIAAVFSTTSRSPTASTKAITPDLASLKEIAKKEDELDEARAAQDSAYGRILADLTTQPMTVTEDVASAPPALGFEMPWAASAPSLEQMDKRMVMLAVESARTVQSKTQLWRYIEEIGIAPLLAAIKKNFMHTTATSEAGSSEDPAATIAASFAFPSSAQSTTIDEAVETGVLRTEAVEAILHLMNIAMDLRVLRAAVEEGPGLVPVVGKDVVSDLIDIVEEPLLLLMPRIIRPRNDQVLYRGQRAAVEVLFQLVLASDKSIQLIQEDGRLLNALQQMTAEGMYAPDSPTYATCHKLLAAIGHNEWRPRQPGQRGLRILSFDGGGTRGVLSVALLKQVMERVGKDVFETFDIICGTSTGGILAVLFGIERSTINEAESLYDKLVSKIFASSPLIQTTKLLLRQSYYDEVVWEQVLQEMLGDNLMIDSMGEGPLSPKVFVASLCLKTNPASLYLWRNYAYGPDQEPKHSGSFRIMVRDALRATTAAPTFFSPLEKDDAKYCDGAFLANNPTAVALNEVRTLYPGVPVECVVSIGTGVHKDQRKADGSYGWEGIVNDLINCATNTEVTHETLSVFLPKSKYYRFNPQTEFFPLDETKPERLARMKRIAREYFWQSENKERLNQLVDLLKKGGSPLPLFRSSSRP